MDVGGCHRPVSGDDLTASPDLVALARERGRVSPRTSRGLGLVRAGAVSEY